LRSLLQAFVGIIGLGFIKVKSAGSFGILGHPDVTGAGLWKQISLLTR
jgi:hypothetical protein